MRRLLLIIVLLANTLEALAQNGLKGRVIEAAGTPVMYAAVMLDSGEKTEADRSIIRLGD